MGRLTGWKLTELYYKHSPSNHVQMVTKGGIKWQAEESRDEGKHWEKQHSGTVSIVPLTHPFTWN